MIVLVLVLIWLVVLTPVIAHKLSSSDVVSSVVRFRANARVMQKVLGHREDALPMGNALAVPPGVSHRQQALRSAERERFRKERQRKVARRRRVVTVTLGIFLVSLLLGALPPLHLLWVFSGLTAFVMMAYLMLLAHFTRLEVNAAERKQKIVHLPQTIFPVPLVQTSAGRN